MNEMILEEIYQHFLDNPLHFIYGYHRDDYKYPKYYRMEKDNNKYFLVSIDGNRRHEISEVAYSTYDEFSDWADINFVLDDESVKLQISEIIPDSIRHKFKDYLHPDYVEEDIQMIKTNDKIIYLQPNSDSFTYDNNEFYFKDYKFDWHLDEQEVELVEEFMGKTKYMFSVFKHYDTTMFLEECINNAIDNYLTISQSKKSLREKLDELYKLRKYDFFTLNEDNKFCRGVTLLKENDEYFFSYNDTKEKVSIDDIKFKDDYFVVNREIRMTYISEYKSYDIQDYGDDIRYKEIKNAR